MTKPVSQRTDIIVPQRPAQKSPSGEGKMYRPTPLENNQMALAANLLEKHNGKIPREELQKVMSQMPAGEAAEFRSRALIKARFYYEMGPSMFKIFKDIYTAKAEGRHTAATNLLDGVVDSIDLQSQLTPEEMKNRNKGVFSRFIRESAAEAKTAAPRVIIDIPAHEPRFAWVTKTLRTLKIIK